MKQLLLILAVVALVGCCTPVPTNPNWVSDPSDPNNVIIEKEIRKAAQKPIDSRTGKLTKADLEKVASLHLEDNQLTDVKGLEKLDQLTRLYLYNNQLTDVEGLEKLTKLKFLNLYNNPALTKAQIAELKKALPNCEIHSNPTK